MMASANTWSPFSIFFIKPSSARCPTHEDGVAQRNSELFSGLDVRLFHATLAVIEPGNAGTRMSLTFDPGHYYVQSTCCD
jgi:hypothetical protein